MLGFRVFLGFIWGLGFFLALVFCGLLWVFLCILCVPRGALHFFDIYITYILIYTYIYSIEDNHFRTTYDPQPTHPYNMKY